MTTKIAKPPMAATKVNQRLDLDGGMSLMVRDAFDNARVADRNEFGGGKALEVGPGKHAAHADDGRDDPDQVEREERLGVAMRVLQDRDDVVNEIERHGAEDPGGDGS